MNPYHRINPDRPLHDDTGPVGTVPDTQATSEDTAFTSPALRMHIAERHLRMDALKAEMTAAIETARDKLGRIALLTDNLIAADFEHPDTGGGAWLSVNDRATLRHQLSEALYCVNTMAAINRPHTGTPLWPQLLHSEATIRTEYVVSYAMADGSGGVVTGDGDGFTTAESAQGKADDLLAGGHVAHAQVKARQHRVSAVGAFASVPPWCEGAE